MGYKRLKKKLSQENQEVLTGIEARCAAVEQIFVNLCEDTKEKVESWQTKKMSYYTNELLTDGAVKTLCELANTALAFHEDNLHMHKHSLKSLQRQNKNYLENLAYTALESNKPITEPEGIPEAHYKLLERK